MYSSRQPQLYTRSGLTVAGWQGAKQRRIERCWLARRSRAGRVRCQWRAASAAVPEPIQSQSRLQGAIHAAAAAAPVAWDQMLGGQRRGALQRLIVEAGGWIKRVGIGGCRTMGLNLALEASNNSQIVFSLRQWEKK